MSQVISRDQKQSSADSSSNPYAAPAADAYSPGLDMRAPRSIYLYAAVLFILGGCAAGFSFSALIVVVATMWETAILALWLVPVVAVWGGCLGGRHMYRRLFKLHQQKVAFEISEANRLGEFY